MFKLILLILFVLGTVNLATAQNQFETDIITTTSGDLKITFIGRPHFLPDLGQDQLRGVFLEIWLCGELTKPLRDLQICMV